ncbi:oxygen-independent coproporphyrinogen III oxidase [Amphibiibacter pelophylacis]|uniref:Oxygen-independent coproporphyrinogen III oxidase n=1 Tax=Amphibiibacter pelophylacis TaxID=1799477 RepID=A0ACC6P0Z1_9BURK
MSALLSDDLLRRFDIPGPRYTSYPTADRFHDAFGEPDLLQALRERGSDAQRAAAPLSVYVHIPFCASVCYYCACNKIITRHTERAAPYLALLQREIGLIATHLGAGRAVSQLHLGGGTPTFFSDDELRTLMDSLRAAFGLAADGEFAIEVDPRTVTPERLQALWDMGFNRLSFGVQDFDPDVQQAVHRIQPAQGVFDLMAAARAIGFRSINADLIYGLPRQTPDSFARTLEQLVQLAPDRVALYAYAHLPARFKPQRRIIDAELPAPGDKLALLRGALHTLQAAGYEHIGMDHFARPDDALAQAKAQGRLHRNFQGYSTQPDCDLIALGVSAIGRMGDTYSQNAKTLEEYEAALGAGHLPVVRGHRLSADDLLRRDLIMAIMCQGRLDADALSLRLGQPFASAFASELARLQPLAEAGLVDIRAGGLRVTEAGWYLVRAIAMVFDTGLNRATAAGGRTQFSKII